MKVMTIPMASDVTFSSFSLREVDARSTISISMQLTTFAKISADSSLVIPAADWASVRIPLAVSRSKLSMGIAPGKPVTSGKRPGAPKVRILARVLENSAALASGATRLSMFVSRPLDFFPKTDFNPRRFFFLGGGLSTTGSISAAASSSSSYMKSASASAVVDSISGLLAASPPINIWNCRCLSSSAAAALSLTILKAYAPPPTVTTTAAAGTILLPPEVVSSSSEMVATAISSVLSSIAVTSLPASDSMAGGESTAAAEAEAAAAEAAADAAAAATAAAFAASFSCFATSFATRFSSFMRSFSAFAAAFVAAFSAAALALASAFMRFCSSLLTPPWAMPFSAIISLALFSPSFGTAI
mmetsp:Transcript_29294/g.62780  ORF Transcript_29294/g.62780 Transcript_29294/m.62780 type:complete len:359 (-) Transcript_29294:290-1366(-)